MPKPQGQGGSRQASGARGEAEHRTEARDPAAAGGRLTACEAARGAAPLVPVGAGRQEFIVQTEGATWDELASESYTVMVGGEVVVTVLLHHRDCLPSCHPLCTC